MLAPCCAVRLLPFSTIPHWFLQVKKRSPLLVWEPLSRHFRSQFLCPAERQFRSVAAGDGVELSLEARICWWSGRWLNAMALGGAGLSSQSAQGRRASIGLDQNEAKLDRAALRPCTFMHLSACHGSHMLVRHARRSHDRFEEHQVTHTTPMQPTKSQRSASRLATSEVTLADTGMASRCKNHSRSVFSTQRSADGVRTTSMAQFRSTKYVR